jgi:hypothetical protein
VSWSRAAGVIKGESCWWSGSSKFKKKKKKERKGKWESLVW